MLGAVAIASRYTETTDEQRAICEMVRQFADEQILPNAEHYDHEDAFPEPIVEQMKELGLFGVTIPEEYGGMGLDLTTYAMIVEELSRGWVALRDRQHALHRLISADEVGHRGARQKYLPQMATGELRAAFSLSDPSSAPTSPRSRPRRANRTTRATRSTGQDVGHQRAACRARVRARPHRPPGRAQAPRPDLLRRREGAGGRREHRPLQGLQLPPQIKKMGYKGVESTELVFDGYRTPAEASSAARTRGSARALRRSWTRSRSAASTSPREVGIAQRALGLALKYSQERKAFGKPIAQHQAIQFKLADMGTQVEAARLIRSGGTTQDAGERADLEAGMAKLFASETGRFCVEECLRIHGGYGYSKDSRSSASTATRRCC